MLLYPHAGSARYSRYCLPLTGRPFALCFSFLALRIRFHFYSLLRRLSVEFNAV